jgi:hypothetical protein
LSQEQAGSQLPLKPTAGFLRRLEEGFIAGKNEPLFEKHGHLSPQGLIHSTWRYGTQPLLEKD